MKRLVSVLVLPLARRVGALAASATAGAMVVDPAIAARLEAWVVAGAMLAVDLASVYIRQTQEGR
nr:hypothetical protein [uncultured Gellertiella sp.]